MNRQLVCSLTFSHLVFIRMIFVRVFHIVDVFSYIIPYILIRFFWEAEVQKEKVV